MRAAKGFTLIELMVVVVVVGILATIGYPSYRDYLLRSKITEAVGNLADMRTKLEQFFLDNRTYLGACVAGTVAPAPAGRYFTYACSNLAGTTYTVTATGVAAEGMAGFTYTIDQANTRATVSVPAGWTASGSCWTLKKDGSC
jgi:type IV pilus assembly protein PilE